MMIALTVLRAALSCQIAHERETGLSIRLHFPFSEPTIPVNDSSLRQILADTEMLD
jgi:hypothetical protein